MPQPDKWPKAANEILNMSLAKGTAQKYFDSSTAQDTTYTYFAILIINDTVFANLTDNNADETDVAGNELSGITIPAGRDLFGDFTNIELTSGVICAIREN